MAPTAPHDPPPPPHPLDVRVGQLLRTRREELGLSRQKLAEQATAAGRREADIRRLEDARAAAERDGREADAGTLAADIRTLHYRRRISAERIRKAEEAVSPLGPGHLYRVSAALGLDIPTLFGNVAAEDPLDPLRTEEGRVLYELFLAIEDPQVRKEVAALVRAVADGKGPGDSRGESE